MFRSIARHLIPENGAWDLPNSLLDENGNAYRRGGSEYLSTAPFGTGLRFIWNGYLGGGDRTVIANSDDFGVLDAGAAPVNLGGVGLSRPKKAVEIGGILFIGGGAMYAGSRKAAVYSTGTVSVTNGSKTVTGSGTTWNTLVDAGMLLQVGGGRAYVVESVDSTTQLTLRDAYAGTTAAGQAYTLSPLAAVGSPYRTSDLYAVAAERLISFEGNKIRFSEPGAPWNFPDVNFHELVGGAELIGGERVGDRLLAFATNGLWVVSGLPLDIVDAAGNAQHRVEHVSPDLILWSHEGIASYQNALVVPCADHVWLVDGISTPVPISKPVAPLYQQYVAQGYRCGLPAVDRSHYFLPIINDDGLVQDELVCRLDQPNRPWTRFTGFSAESPAYAVRAGGAAAARNPELLAAGTNGRVLNCSGFFGPEVENEQEADGSTHEWTIITRDYATGDGFNINTVRYARTRYELVGDAAPAMTLSYSVGARVDTSGYARFDEAVFDVDVFPPDDAETDDWIALPGVASADDGRVMKDWMVNKEARHIRFRLQLTQPASKAVLRSLEVFARARDKP